MHIQTMYKGFINNWQVLIFQNQFLHQMSLPKPLDTPIDNNVLCSRGNCWINYPGGNIFLRQFVHSLKLEYDDLPNRHKREFQLQIYNKVAEYSSCSWSFTKSWYHMVSLFKVWFIEKILQHFWTELLSCSNKFCDVVPPTKVDNNIDQIQLMEILNNLLLNK